MNGTLFTLAELHTVGGVSLAVLLVVQLIKELPFLKNVPTKGLAVVVGEVLLIAIDSPLPHTVADWVVLLLNGIVVSSAAVGGWHLGQGIVSTVNKKNS